MAYKVEPPLGPFTYGHRFINGPMNNWFQANDHQLPLEISEFKKVDNRRCNRCLHEELGMLSHNYCGEFRMHNGASALKC